MRSIRKHVILSLSKDLQLVPFLKRVAGDSRCKIKCENERRRGILEVLRQTQDDRVFRDAPLHRHHRLRPIQHGGAAVEGEAAGAGDGHLEDLAFPRRPSHRKIVIFVTYSDGRGSERIMNECARS